MTFGDFEGDYAELAAIVADLAMCDPFGSATYCHLCGGEEDVDVHKPSCPYLRAVNHRARHATSGGEPVSDIGDSGCSHKTMHDHSQPHGERRLWQCTACKRVAVWGRGWEYHGNVECPKCATAAVDWVVCSAKCKTEMNKATKGARK